jgi:hypothetical protein
MGSDCVTSCGDTVLPAHVAVMLIFAGLFVVTRVIAWAAERRRLQAVAAVLREPNMANETSARDSSPILVTHAPLPHPKGSL